MSSSIIDPIVRVFPPTRKVTNVAITIPAAGKNANAAANGLVVAEQTLAVWLTGNGTTVANGLIANPYLQGNVVGVSLGANTSGMTVNCLIQGY
jgi:hypothetical protein